MDDQLYKHASKSLGPLQYTPTYSKGEHLLGFQRRMIFFYRVNIDSVPENLDPIIEKCFELYQLWPKVKLEVDGYQFLFNYDPAKFCQTMGNGKLSFYEISRLCWMTYTAIADDGEILHETEDAAAFMMEGRLHVMGHLAYENDAPPAFRSDMAVVKFHRDHETGIPSGEVKHLDKILEEMVVNNAYIIDHRNEYLPEIVEEQVEARMIDRTSTSDEEKSQQIKAYQRNVQQKIKSYSYGVCCPGRKATKLTEWLREEIQKDETLTGAAARDKLNEMHPNKRAKILESKDKAIPDAQSLGTRIGREKKKMSLNGG